MKLSKEAEQMSQLLLKHYPMGHGGKQKSSHNHSQHKKPQQHMHDYRKEREIYEKPTKQKLENMQFFKEEGNNHYKNQRYNEALYFYQKVIIYSDYTFPDNETETSKMEALLQQSNCNLALSLIKLNRWQQARTNLIEATKGKNLGIKAKANYWLAKHYLRECQPEQAIQSIKEIQLLGQEHKKFVEQLQLELQKIKKRQQNESKQTFKNMFKQ